MNVISNLKIEELEQGRSTFWLKLITDNLGKKIYVPIIAIKAKRKGPTVILNSLLHGDELNGLEVVHSLCSLCETDLKAGTVIAIPVFNMPRYQEGSRYFSDETDLNTIMPGRARGTLSERYANKILKKVIFKADYLFDLHTARNGHRNIFYVRADLSDTKIRKIAPLLNANLILDHKPTITTLRGTAATKDIPAFTFELGDPFTYQKGIIERAVIGIKHALYNLKMTKSPQDKTRKSLICSDSYRIFSEEEGIIEIIPKLFERVRKGQKIANLKDIFGEIKQTFYADRAGIVIGRISNPILQANSRFIHIGQIQK